MRRSGRSASVLVGLGLLATLLALVTGYTRHALLDAGQFGDRAVEAVRAEPVRQALSTALADELITRQPRLLSARPILISAASSVLASRATGGLISRGAIELHRALLSEDQPSIVLDVADLTVVVRSYLEATGSDIADRLDGSTSGQLSVTVATREASTNAIRVARRVSLTALLSPLVALALFAAAIALAPDRRRILLGIGLGLMGVAALTASAYVIGRGYLVAAGGGGDTGEVLGAVLDAFFGSILLWATALGAAGVLLASSAATMLSRLDAPSLPRAAWAWVTRTPAARGRRALRDAALVVLGGLIVVNPQGALVVVASIAGGWLALVGLTGLLSSVSQLAATTDGVAPRPHPALLGAVGAALLLPVIAGVAVAAASHPGAAKALGVTDASLCNGGAQLCDRRLDQIVFPTSHNAMSTAAAGFLNANHAAGLIDQLDLGIRGLLIDALAGQRNAQGTVRTDLTGSTEDKVVAQIGRQGLAAAQRLAGRVAFGPIQGEKTLFLCHVLCELGADPAEAELERIHDWLARNPREVLIIFIQDEALPSLVVPALENSGLADDAVTIDPTKPMPTLRQLIDGGRRAVILAENHGGSPAWYHDGFKLFQDTPYSFTRTAQLRTEASCALNRGSATDPMLLVNHWVETYPPNPVNADVSNQPELLLDRAKRCQALRDLPPTLLAVDFVERGDVVGAAKALNAVAPTN